MVYTSRVTTDDIFHYSPLLVLLVCKALSPPGMLTSNESFLLLQNGNIDVLSKVAAVRYVQRGERLELNCTEKDTGFVVWKKAATSMNPWADVLAYSVFIKDVFTKIFITEVSLDNKGNLVIPEVEVNHEGKYICIFGDGLNESVSLFQVSVYVQPVPAYPLIQGCNSNQHCVLEVEKEGILTCEIIGIRPLVKLEWKVPSSSQATLISFLSHQLTVKDKGDTYDVTLTSLFRGRDSISGRITVECGVVEPNEIMYDLTTELHLLFNNETTNPTKQIDVAAKHKLFHWLFSAIGASLMLILLTVVIIKKKRNRARRKVPGDQENEEMTAMIKPRDTNALRLTGLTGSIQETDGKQVEDCAKMTPTDANKDHVPGMKEQFLKQLKEKYKDFYDAVQPIPYIKDRLYCVDLVFVESGIEFLDSKERRTKPKWTRLDSYKDVFKEDRIKSTRRILEGEPGYGKSTITLQFLYDWCNNVQTFAPKHPDVLIFLRLRQLGGVTSIYKAIKQFLLPKDSKVSDRDIENILRDSHSVMILLDGYDEYPDQESSVSDVMSIIDKSMFQEFEVLLTTRSSVLPQKYPPVTKRMKLTGFDGKARANYICKAVVSDDNDDKNVKKIEGYLEENPILKNLCQIPLLFVIFAHMTYESEEFRKINSVTSFFRYMITCFHSHMRNKMEDANVSKFTIFENEHGNLDRVAFEALSKDNKRIIWKKDKLCEQLGQEFYDQYIRIGILVEEEVIDIVDDPGTLMSEHVQYKKEVRFHNKLFCEWYAAHYLSDSITQTENLDLNNFLQHLHPYDVQFLYRFSCGITKPNSAKRIIDHVKNIEDGDKFAILCILEQTGDIENVIGTIRQLCYEGLIISSTDSLLLETSSVQLLQIAAKNDISIQFVDLDDLVQSVDLTTASIKIRSGLALSSKIPIKELQISLYNRDMTKEEAIDILKFSLTCPSLRVLRFGGSLPPRSFEEGSTLSALKSNNVTVKCLGVFYSPPMFVLDLSTGRWHREEDGIECTEEDFEKMEASWKRLADLSEEDFRRDVRKLRESLKKRAEKNGLTPV
ncbi:NACHT, LRR and PYD domains-containing protein 1b allele 5 [Holothuria leucospilota]|uniref:NACHT, LRR and PYD domains-containing protein 1b allele 5 n=1 Tax=Holothuria leucospilota TaxID=206669 RepID=A0A9Q1CT99_HOLLE|nr:NACHT, LRR and PYD domains-containing protein 1b allele 5 [Holothuria leucospilota]